MTIILSGSDIDGDTLTFSIVVPAHQGSLGPLTSTSPTSASVVYAPNGDYRGSDSFTFNVSDGSSTGSPATVDITVKPINDMPLAAGHRVDADEDTSVSISLTGSDIDGDALAFSIVAPTQNGSLGPLTSTGAHLASVVYSPQDNFHGDDFFTFKVSDDSSDSSSATVRISVNPVNDPPRSIGQRVATGGDTPLTITLSGADIDGDPLTFSILAPPGKGSLGPLTSTSRSPASVLYSPMPDSGHEGPDVFTFTVNDGSLDSGPATVQITINPADNPPSASSRSANTNEDTLVTITLSGSDIDGDSLEFSIVVPPHRGSLGSLTSTATPSSFLLSFLRIAGL